MCISVLRVVRTKVWICPLKQPESAQTRIIFTLWATWGFFFLILAFFDVYLQAENHGISYCMLTFSICWSLALEGDEKEGPKQKMHTDVLRGLQAERLLFLTMLCTLATNTKKVQLFWHQCFGHKIPTPLFSFVCLLFFSCCCCFQ